MDVLLPSSPEAVEKWCSELRQSLEDLQDRKDRFALELLFREALQNALSHGNTGLPGLSIRCSLTIQDGEAVGMVTHQGPGRGDCQSPSVCPDFGCENGRGMALISLYSDFFEWTDQGQTILFKRRLSAEGESWRT